MSVRAVQWALETSVGDATAKLVLLALADEADGDGLCWPFMRRLAARAEVSEKTVSRKIVFLEAAGLLTRSDRKRRRSGRLSGYHYTLALPPQDNLSGGHEATDEDAAGGADPAAPVPQARERGAGATDDSDAPSPAPSDPDRSAERQRLAGAVQPPADNVSGGPADNLSHGPPDTAVSGGPADIQVSGGKEDPPCTDPPPPPTPTAGGGGSAAAERRARPLVAGVAALLDDERKQLRLLTEPPGRLDALEAVLEQRTADGWTPDALAAQLTDGTFERIGSLAGVLRGRAERLAGATPPARRPRSDAAGIPADVRLALEGQVQEEELDAGDVDPARARRRLEELTSAWLAEHGLPVSVASGRSAEPEATTQEVGAR